MNKFFKDRGFGLKIGYGDRPSLIVIDLVQGFTDLKKPLGADLSAPLPETRRVLDVARRARIPVYYTTVSYEERDIHDAGIWAKKMGGLMTLRSGQPEVEVDPSLGRLPDEPVITKKYASAFFGTDLLARLNSLRIDTLLIVGCTMSGCVRAPLSTQSRTDCAPWPSEKPSVIAPRRRMSRVSSTSRPSTRTSQARTRCSSICPVS